MSTWTESGTAERADEAGRRMRRSGEYVRDGHGNHDDVNSHEREQSGAAATTTTRTTMTTTTGSATGAGRRSFGAGGGTGAGTFQFSGLDARHQQASTAAKRRLGQSEPDAPVAYGYGYGYGGYEPSAGARKLKRASTGAVPARATGPQTLAGLTGPPRSGAAAPQQPPPQRLAAFVLGPAPAATDAAAAASLDVTTNAASWAAAPSSRSHHHPEADLPSQPHRHHLHFHHQQQPVSGDAPSSPPSRPANPQQYPPQTPIRHFDFNPALPAPVSASASASAPTSARNSLGAHSSDGASATPPYVFSGSGTPSGLVSRRSSNSRAHQRHPSLHTPPTPVSPADAPFDSISPAALRIHRRYPSLSSSTRPAHAQRSSQGQSSSQGTQHQPFAHTPSTPAAATSTAHQIDSYHHPSSDNPPTTRSRASTLQSQSSQHAASSSAPAPESAPASQHPPLSTTGAAADAQRPIPPSLRDPSAAASPQGLEAALGIARSRNLGSLAASVTLPNDSTETIVALRPHQRQAPAVRSSDGPETLSGPPALITQGLDHHEPQHQQHSASSGGDASGAPSRAADTYTSPSLGSASNSPPGGKELILPRTLERSDSNDTKRSSVTRRPPVSYKPPANANSSGGSASIPPIRGFRSSGSRRSLNLDMNQRSALQYDLGDEYGDAGHRDRSLRALEGRQDDFTVQMTPPDSAGARADADDNGDVFLRIAREDSSRRTDDESDGYFDGQSTVSRPTRSSRRPLSNAMPPHQPPIPLQMPRRMSDHQESMFARSHTEDQHAERIGRAMTVRGHSREPTSDDYRYKGPSGTIRASPLTPRSLTFQEATTPEASSGYRQRRQPSVDYAANATSRLSSLKQAFSHGRNYSSSPLAPKTADPQKQDAYNSDVNQGHEAATDSTASTAAPSTVWDELDDLKSRIHRLELTGKLPPTSGAAISRASDDRPPTATTNATTMSASPKRESRSGAQPADASSFAPNQNTQQTGPTTALQASPQKESHPVLHSALAKSKQFLTSEVYGALETAAHDALSLSSMMGSSGQPGPISSAASAAGGPAVTDRQLRRKADSVCRSLTELCLALSEGVAQSKNQAAVSPTPETPLTSPTITTSKFQSIGAGSRRPSQSTDRNIALSAATSPRAVSRYEEKRNSMLSANAIVSPRYNPSSATTPTEANGAGRKSSLLLARTRRAQTEEPEESRVSSVLRSRRAGTEEPESSPERKTSVLTRGRRATIENDDDVSGTPSRFRAPSRAATEVQAGRTAPREYSSQVPLPSAIGTATSTPNATEAASLGSSALPRRRMGSSAINAINTNVGSASANTTPTRLIQPAVTSGLGSRRYLERSTPDREGLNSADRPPVSRDNRRFSLSQSQPSATARSSANMGSRSNRSSMIAAPPTAQSGGYYR